MPRESYLVALSSVSILNPLGIFCFLIYGLTETKNQIIVKMEQSELLKNLARIYDLNDFIQIYFIFLIASYLTFFPIWKKKKKSLAVSFSMVEEV